MKGLPWFQCYPSAVLTDTEYNRSSLSTRGFWTHAWMTMRLNGTDRLAGRIEDLAKDCKCTTEEAVAAIDEIEDRGVGIVERDGDTITLVCRRCARDLGPRENARKRQKEYRERQKDRAAPKKKTPVKKNPASPEDPPKDWLADLSKLKAFVPELKRLFVAAFEGSTLPPDAKIQKQLRDLAAIDKFSERDIVDTLRWWLTSQVEDAVFWRENGCHSILRTRDKKTPDDTTKFWKMNRKRGASSRSKSEWTPPVSNHGDKDNLTDQDDLPF